MEVVKNVWQGLSVGDSAMQMVRRKLQSCQKALVGWSSSKYRNSVKTLAEKSKQLEALQKTGGPGNRSLIKQL